MLSIVLSMSIFAFVGAASPGPVNIIATTSSVNFGLIKTIPHVLGASFGYALIVFLVGIGLSTVLDAYQKLTTIVSYLGAAFLLHMSYKIAFSKETSIDSDSAKKAPKFWQGALAQWLNPKAWLVSMSGISLFVVPHQAGSVYLMIFTLLSFIICILGVGLWAVSGKFIRKYLAKESHRVQFNRVMGFLLSMTVVSMLL